MIWGKFMARRGPKAADLKMLQFWEHEWWQALRFLREGRRDLWDDLVSARSVAELRGICKRWEKWRDQVLGRTAFARARKAGIFNRPRQEWPDEVKHLPKANPMGPAGFPAPRYVRQYEQQFFAAIKDKRFPRKRKSADDARLDHLARAMAGVFCGREPATGVDLLRRIQHDLKSKEHVNACWRCSLERSRQFRQSELYKRLLEAQKEARKELARIDRAWYTAFDLRPAWTLLGVNESKPGSEHWTAEYTDASGQMRIEKFYMKEETKP